MIPGIIESSRSVTPFTDTFNRANAANIATIEYEWVETSGDWQIDSNTAYTPTSSASYPLAVFDAQKANVDIRSYSSGTNNAGFGAAFWVVDSNNWWAAVTESTTSTQSTTTYSCPNGGTLSGTTCLKTCTTQTLVGYTGGTCPNNQSVTPDSNCICNDPGGCNCGSDLADPSTCTCYAGGVGPEQFPGQCASLGYVSYGGVCYTSTYSGTVVAPYTYTGTGCTPVYQTTTSPCNYAATATTTTSTVYTHTMRLLKRESGVVTQVTTSTFSTGAIDLYLSSIQVLTNENVVTVTGVNGSTSVSFSHTASNPTRGTKHGIIIAPASRTQSTRIDQFDYVN